MPKTSDSMYLYILGCTLISNGRFLSKAKFLFENYVIGNIGEANLNFPSSILRGF